MVSDFLQTLSIDSPGCPENFDLSLIEIGQAVSEISRFKKNRFREEHPRVDAFRNLIFALKQAMVEIKRQTKGAFL